MSVSKYFSEKLLDNLKDCMRKKYQTVTEALEEYVSEKIGEITTLHRYISCRTEVVARCYLWLFTFYINIKIGR